jgi:hypothetical protein
VLELAHRLAERQGAGRVASRLDVCITEPTRVGWMTDHVGVDLGSTAPGAAGIVGLEGHEATTGLRVDILVTDLTHRRPHAGHARSHDASHDASHGALERVRRAGGQWGCPATVGAVPAALKDSVGAAVVDDLARRFAEVDDHFDARGFADRTTPQLGELELKARIELIARELWRALGDRDPASSIACVVDVGRSSAATRTRSTGAVATPAAFSSSTMAAHPDASARQLNHCPSVSGVVCSQR